MKGKIVEIEYDAIKNKTLHLLEIDYEKETEKFVLFLTNSFGEDYIMEYNDKEMKVFIKFLKKARKYLLRAKVEFKGE